jgi:hypothetical protein
MIAGMQYILLKLKVELRLHTGMELELRII